MGTHNLKIQMNISLAKNKHHNPQNDSKKKIVKTGIES